MKNPIDWWLPLGWPVVAYAIVYAGVTVASLWIGFTSSSARQSFIRAGLLGALIGLAYSCGQIVFPEIQPDWYRHPFFLLPFASKVSNQFSAVVVVPVIQALNAGLLALLTYMARSVLRRRP